MLGLKVRSTRLFKSISLSLLLAMIFQLALPIAVSALRLSAMPLQLFSRSWLETRFYSQAFGSGSKKISNSLLQCIPREQNYLDKKPDGGNVSPHVTGGPSQPEFSRFTPVSTTEMVDPFTGNFTYNLPLLDVDGYPVN